MLRERATEQLALGHASSTRPGDFDNALKNLTASLDHGLLTKADQSIARKYLAFIHCVSNREAQCRDEFRKAFEINPDFSLTTAEDGHPIWGPVYRNVRTQLIAEREAAAARVAPAHPARQGRADARRRHGEVRRRRLRRGAARSSRRALKEGLKDKADQVKALKHIAFSLCLQEQVSASAARRS